jgi:hypothetical protein
MTPGNTRKEKTIAMSIRRMFSFVALSAILCCTLPLQAQESKPAPKQTIGTNSGTPMRMTATGLVFPDGSVLSTATSSPGGTPTGTSIVTAINSGSTVGTINDNRLAPNLARVAVANTWSALNTFNGT